jgi:hypothetical protein
VVGSHCKGSQVLGGCRVTERFALYIDKLPPPNNHVAIFRADIIDYRQWADDSGTPRYEERVELVLDSKSNLLLRETRHGLPTMPAVTLPISSRSWTIVHFDIRETAYAVSVDVGTPVIRERTLKGLIYSIYFGALDATAGPPFDYHLDAIRHGDP